MYSSLTKSSIIILTKTKAGVPAFVWTVKGVIFLLNHKPIYDLKLKYFFVLGSNNL